MKTQNYSRPPYQEGLVICESVASPEEQGFDFLSTPTIFGAKAQDVIEGADAAVGTAHLLTTFSISAPGDLRTFWMSSLTRHRMHRFNSALNPPR